MKQIRVSGTTAESAPMNLHLFGTLLTGRSGAGMA